MVAVATSPFYEVQGLVLCPVQEQHKCSEPERWLPIFFLDTARQRDGALVHAMDSDSPVFERYEDFRRADPTPDKLAARLTHTGYAWESPISNRPAKKRRVAKTAPLAEVIDISTAKKGKKKDKGKGKKAKKK